jgi:hypothetical protein
MTGVNTTTTLNDDKERIEGSLSTDGVDSLDLGLEEDEIVRIIGDRVSKAEAFWNKELDLDNVRKNNESYWLNKQVDEDAMYDYQVPYKNNRIFVSIESLIPMAISRPPQPLVTPGNDSDASKEKAKNVQDFLLGKYEDLYMKSQFHMVSRHLLAGNRIAYMKVRWDDELGEMTKDEEGKMEPYGDCNVYVPRPQRVVIEQGSNDKWNVPLIGEYMSASVEEIGYRFPDKKDEFWKEQGVKRGTSGQLHKQAGYVETWVSYFDKDGKKKEMVAWKSKSVLLDAMKNPYWNYDDETQNFLKRPPKPYAIFNHLNMGKHLIDDTSLSEQAQPMQDIANKRGRQIVENADQANSGTVYNSEMISPDTVAQLVGDPNEKAMVKGPPQEAAMRLPQNMLPQYVVEDKREALSEVDNIFGVHDPMRGEQSGNRTLGQDVLSQRSDLSRNSTLATSIEDGADMLYKILVQTAKVYYQDAQEVKYTGSDGNTNSMQFGNKTIEQGMKIRVKSGSVLPDDPAAKEAQTLKALAILDPLTIGEGLNKPDPKDFAKRNVYYHFFPDRYITEYLNEDPNGMQVDPQAMQEIQTMNQGQMAPPQEQPSKAHLATHDQFMKSPQFKTLAPEIQQLHVQHVKMEIDNAKNSLGQEVNTPGETVGDANTPAGNVAPPASAPQPQPQATPTNNVPPKGIIGKVRDVVGL